MTFRFGLVHAPVTPFAADRSIDVARFDQIVDFHLGHGAEALALPMHAGESVSLSVAEREALLTHALRRVAGRVPVVAHVSEAGTAIAAGLAAHAHAAGAAAVIASVPYYWTPPQSMLVEHFAAIAEAGRLPFFVHNTPSEMAEMTVSPRSVTDLLQRCPHVAGLIDSSLDWQYMIEVVTVAGEIRPDFQFVSGTEYMISAGAVGATGLVSSIAGVAPRLVRGLFDACRAERYGEARAAQVDAAILFRALRDTGPAGLKAVARSLGRDCGGTRPPLPGLDPAETDALMATLAAATSLQAEPRGWT